MERQNRSGIDVEALPGKFFNAIDQQLSEYPQIGAIILDGLSVACTRVAELLENFSAQLEERCDELKKAATTKGKDRKRDGTNNYKSAKKQSSQGASAH